MLATRIYTHPFRDGVKRMLEKHFHPDIADNFVLVLEKSLYDSKNVYQMFKNDRIILEVHYKEGDTQEYVCDLYGWESKTQTENKLLTFITDAYKAGRIGRDWGERQGLIGKEVSSKKHITPLTAEEIYELQNNKKSRN